MNPHDYPPAQATVTRIKASHKREELPVSMQPTWLERVAASWTTPTLLVIAAFGCAVVIVYAVR